MITVKQTREKNGESYNLGDIEFENSVSALARLIEVELKYGGMITAVTEESVKVETDICSCRDISIFEGSAEEMLPMFKFAIDYLKTQEDYHDLVVEAAADQALEQLGGNPLFLSLAAPLLTGRNLVKVVMMTALGIEDRADIEIGLAAGIKDLAAAIELQQEGACTFREALAS